MVRPKENSCGLPGWVTDGGGRTAGRSGARVPPRRRELRNTERSQSPAPTVVEAADGNEKRGWRTFRVRRENVRPMRERNEVERRVEVAWTRGAKEAAERGFLLFGWVEARSLELHSRE